MKKILTNLKIYTMDSKNTVIENGYIVMDSDSGKIILIGEGYFEKFEGNALVDSDNDSEYINDGGIAFPGFIDGHTHIGIIGDSLTFEGDDVNEASDPSTPHMRGIDAINPFDRCFGEALAAGITTVAAGPGSANPIGGQFCAMKTYGKRIDKMVIQAPIAMKFAFGENPKNVYHGKNQAPETRMATAAIIRDALYKAKKYAEDKDKAKNSDEDDDIDEPEFDIKNEALEPVIRGEVAAHFHAHRADDIFTAIRIAKEFGLTYKIIHCTEGHLIADELASENVEVFAGPNLSDRSKPELSNMSFANAGILERVGIKIGITTDHPVTPLKYLPICAALAVKEGLSKAEAYRAITINPAQILGISDRVGSLEIGKDADIAIFNGDPLEIFTEVKHVFINGKDTFNGK